MLQRRIRAAVINMLADTARAPSAVSLSARLDLSEADVVGALHALADEHRLVLTPGTDSVWMAYPFSAIPTDFVVGVRERRWFANCVWDGLSILGLFGDGVLETHSPASGEPIALTVDDGLVSGKAIVHFLVPARHFWDDIGFT